MQAKKNMVYSSGWCIEIDMSDMLLLKNIQIYTKKNHFEPGEFSHMPIVRS